MAYSLESELTAVVTPYQRLALLDDTSSGTEVAGLATTMIADADSIIDGIISARYDVPLGTTPDRIKYLSLHIARALMYIRKGSPPDHILADHTACLEMLAKIASGEVGIGIDPRPTERTGLQASVTSATRQMGRTNLAAI